MTTEDTSAVAEETTEERSVSALLNLDKYDGLTDGEVRKLIAYKEKMAKLDAEANIHRETATQMYETSVAASAAACEATYQVLQSLIDSHTNFEGVSPTAITEFLTSMEEV